MTNLFFRNIIWLLFKNLDNSFLSFEYLMYPNTPLKFDENFSRSFR